MKLDDMICIPPPAVTLTSDLLTPNLISASFCKPNYICDQNWVKFSLLGFEIYCSQGFRDAQSHSLTDGHTRTQNASDIESFRWRVHKNQFTVETVL